MGVELKRVNSAFHFKATTGDEHRINIDANPAIGGEGKGARPMELVLAGLAGCASIDLGLILKKQKQNVVDYKVNVTGERKGDASKAFKAINLHFTLVGDIEESKLKKAIDLTLEKYCSVALSLRDDIKIEYTYEVVDQVFRDNSSDI